MCSAKYGLSYFAGKWSDKKGGVGRVYREHRGSVPESKRFDLTKIQLSPNWVQKDPKEIAKKFRDATGEPGEKRLPLITKLKGISTKRPYRLSIYHTEKRSRRATPEIFSFLSVPCGGQFHSRRESSRRTTHALRVSVDCLTEYLNTMSF